MATRRGEFEACFADGLDLSELTTSATSPPTTTFETSDNRNKSSHAANLLRIKQAEAAIKLENVQEEIILHHFITIRSKQLKQVVSNTKISIPKLPAPTVTQHLQPQVSQLSKNTHEAEKTIMCSTSSSNMIHSVLVGMHDESNQKGHDNMPRKMLMKRNLNNNGKNSKKLIAKKTMKRKF